MTNEHIESLINKLNNSDTDGLIHLRPLSVSVDFAKVWGVKPKPINEICSSDGPDKYYFIKNSCGEYVAAVYDMIADLHWFVCPAFRKKGYLTKALKEVILFHLFQNRKSQRITIDFKELREFEANSSLRVAESLGFIKSSESEYSLSESSYRSDEFICGENTPLSNSRAEELKRQLNYIGNSLWMVHSEVEMKLGVYDYAEELKELVDKVKHQVWEFEDVWLKSKGE
jgi:hypothetical protein